MKNKNDKSPRLVTPGAIVVGVDDSPSSAAALGFARAFARRIGAECHLIHAVESGHDPVADGLRVREVLDAAGLPLGIEGMQTKIGPAAEVLSAHAAQVGAQLIILGGKHHSLLGRWVAGSTAMDLIRNCQVPVLVTRGPLARVDRVLVGADSTPAAFGAIRMAEMWADLWDAELRVVHTVGLPASVPEYTSGYEIDIAQEQGEAEAAKMVFPLIGRESAERVVEVGSASVVLSEQALGWPADLLVVARHDRGRLLRAALGSTTERLLDALPVSILVVPASKAEAKARVVAGMQVSSSP